MTIAPPLPMRVALRRRLEWITIACITIVGVAISAAWAFTVPLFENPDEIMHFDYAYSIYGAGRLILAREATTEVRGGYTSPDVAYLAQASGVNRIAFHPLEHVASTYGTRTYLSNIERDAPPRNRAYYANPRHTPTYLAIYPFGYYVLAALAIGAVTKIHPGVLSAFFAARLFSIAIFGLTLVVAGALMRAIRLDGVTAVLALCALALLPLCSFLSASIQPDVLVCLGLTGTALALYRYQEAPRLLRMLPVSLCVVLTLFTKPNYAIAPALATGLALFVVWPRVSRKQFVGHAAVAIIPAVAAFYIDRHMQWQPPGFPSLLAAGSLWQDDFNHGIFDAARARGLAPFAAYVLAQLAVGFRDFYLDGPVTSSYWGDFGWLDAPIRYAHQRLGMIVSGSTVAYDYVIAVCSALSIAAVFIVAIRIGARRSLLDKVRVIVRDPLLNVLFAHYAFMLAIFVYWPNFGFQGRYFYPVVVLSVIAAVRFAPRFLYRASSRILFGRMIALWFCLYSLTASQAAAGTIRARYYPARSLGLVRSVTNPLGATPISSPLGESLAASTIIGAGWSGFCALAGSLSAMRVPTVGKRGGNAASCLCAAADISRG